MPWQPLDHNNSNIFRFTQVSQQFRIRRTAYSKQRFQAKSNVNRFETDSILFAAGEEHQFTFTYYTCVRETRKERTTTLWYLFYRKCFRKDRSRSEDYIGRNGRSFECRCVEFLATDCCTCPLLPVQWARVRARINDHEPMDRAAGCVKYNGHVAEEAYLAQKRKKARKARGIQQFFV